MSAKVQKLENQFNTDVNKHAPESSASGIFSGISVFVNGYTDPPAEEIKRIMMVHGGTYQHYYKRRPNCYMIATNLPLAKLKDIRDYVVTPKWITDCISASKLLPVSQYLLYSPSLKEGQKQISSFNRLPPATCTALADGSAHRENCEFQALEENSQSKDYTTDHSVDTSSAISDGVHNESGGATTTYPEGRHSGDPKFLEEFYSRSRLHHISTASIKMREYVEQLRSSSNGSFEGRERLKAHLQESTSRQLYEAQDTVIMHVDMDCFFVSVGLRFRPELRGTPVAVCHAKNGQVRDGSGHVKEDSRSEVASCSYEARKAGVRSGMFLGQAKKLCPTIRTIPYDFESYDLVSKMLYNIVASYTLDIEAVSCDELYADVSGILREVRCTPEAFAAFLRKEIEDKTLCTASAGLGPNMLAARVANRSAKPNGHRYVSASELSDFFKSVAVKDLPGVGYKLQSELTNMNVETCEDLQALTLEMLRSKFGGKTGTCLYEHARGIDKRSLQLHKVRKSVSAEVNYGIRFRQNDDMINFILQLAKEVEKRLRDAKVQGCSITLKLKVRQKEAPTEPAKFMGHGLCDNITKSTHLLMATDSADVIGKECCSLAAQLSLVPEDIRGVGIQVGRLEQHTTLGRPRKTLFDFVETDNAPHRNPQLCTKSADAAVPSATNTSMQQNRSPSPPLAPLPKFSEIDLAVLESLPEEIRREMLTMYKETSSTSEQTRDNNASLFKGRLKQQNTGKRVGRPPKSSPQKASTSYSLRGYMTSSSKPSGLPVGRAASISHVIDRKSKSDELKRLLKEWISSGEAITTPDIEAWTGVLNKIVGERNLEKVDHLLKFFHRNVQQSGSQKWKDAYMTVINTVQAEILQEFGYFMKISTF